jgi:hypothetical protein
MASIQAKLKALFETLNRSIASAQRSSLVRVRTDEALMM